MVSVTCEQLLDEDTVKLWLLHDHPNFKYRLYMQLDGITDKQTDGRSNYYMPLTNLSSRGQNFFYPWSLNQIQMKVKYYIPTYFHSTLGTVCTPVPPGPSSWSCVWPCSLSATGSIAWHNTTCPFPASYCTALKTLSLARFQTRSFLLHSIMFWKNKTVFLAILHINPFNV